jgi:hypothetical protein
MFRKLKRFLRLDLASQLMIVRAWCWQVCGEEVVSGRSGHQEYQALAQRHWT